MLSRSELLRGVMVRGDACRPATGVDPWPRDGECGFDISRLRVFARSGEAWGRRPRVGRGAAEGLEPLPRARTRGLPMGVWF